MHLLQFSEHERGVVVGVEVHFMPGATTSSDNGVIWGKRSPLPVIPVLFTCSSNANISVSWGADLDAAFLQLSTTLFGTLAV